MLSESELSGNSRYRKEARAQQLDYLEQLLAETIGDTEPPLVCTVCMNTGESGLCACDSPVFWPVYHAVLLLRDEVNNESNYEN